MLPLLLALGLLLPLAGPAYANHTDYDTDDDGLIEINNAEQLGVVYCDANADASPTATCSTAFYAAYPHRINNQLGCPASGCLGFELTTNITLTASTASPPHNFTPIDNFTGAIFEGNGYTVSGLQVNHNDRAGMFGIVGSSGIIRNLGIISPSIRTTRTNRYAGGLAANLGSGGQIINSYVSGGSVTTAGDFGGAGGLAGSNIGSISSSYSTASVTTGGSLSIINVGGLVGNNSGSITDSYAAGATSGTAGLLRIGGLTGRYQSGAITNSYCDTQATGRSCGSNGRTTSQLQTPTGYTGIYQHWNRDQDNDKVPDYLWNFGSSTDYPTLNTPAQRAALVPAAMDYDADDDGLIEISTAAQLNAVRWDLDGDGDPASGGATAYSTAFGGRTHTADVMTGLMGCPVADGCTGYELAASLSLAADYPAWTPLGSSTAQFAATFDGRGHYVAGLTVSSGAAAGLFGYVGNGGIIQNLGVIGARVTVSSDGGSGGAIAGVVDAGGVLHSSYASRGAVTAAADFTTTGGLVGGNTGGAIRASYATNAVTISGTRSNNDLGGLAGYSNGTIVASYAAGAVSGSGGSSNTYAGFVGRSSQAASSITDSYCDTQAAGQPDCIGRQTSGSSVTADGYTTRQLQAPTGYETLYANWNIDLSDPADGVGDDPWDFGTERHYPLLKIDQDGDGRATCREFSGQPCYRAPTPPPYNPAHDHPEIYANPRHQMATSCAVQTTGEGDDAKSTSTLTFDLGSYTRPLTLALSLWDGTHFRSLQSQGITMPELRQDGQTATVEVVTDPAQTRFRIDSEYGLNLVLGYADCHTDDP